MDAQPHGDSLAVQFRLRWHGGFGVAHATTVNWTANAGGSVAVAVPVDDGIVGVSQGATERMFKYFQAEVFPLLLKYVEIER